MSIYIELFHGRKDPDETLDGWGFSGPILGPYPFFHITYKDHVRCGDDMELTYHGDMIEFGGAYYGDVSVIGEVEGDRAAWAGFLARHRETQRVLGLDKKMLPTLLASETEWVRIYGEYKLRGE